MALLRAQYWGTRCFARPSNALLYTSRSRSIVMAKRAEVLEVIFEGLSLTVPKRPVRRVEVCDSGRITLSLSRPLSDADFEGFMEGDNRAWKIMELSNTCILAGIVGIEGCGVGGDLFFQVNNWMRKGNSDGLVGNHRVAYYLPERGVRYIPDVSAFPTRASFDKISKRTEAIFLGAPPFVIELAYPSDFQEPGKPQIRPSLTQKVENYLLEGCKMAFIVDYLNKIVYRYTLEVVVIENGVGRANYTLDTFNDPVTGDVDGGDVLAGFQMDFDSLKRGHGWG